MSNNDFSTKELKLILDTPFFNPFFYRNREHCTDYGTATALEETNT